MNVPEPIRLIPRDAGVLDQLADLKGVAGIYALSLPGSSPHLGWTTNLQRRLKRLLLSSYAGSQTLLGRLSDHAACIEYWPTSSRLESALILYTLARRWFPGDYLRVLRLRMPWFVSLADQENFARLEVTNRLPAGRSLSLGPFVSRGAAQQYEEAVTGLFQIRRCVETLNPDASHPGCIYGEMNQCLRPCQCAVTREEYASEAARAAELLRTNGRAAIAALSAARERASADMEFEQAAQAHKRAERIKAVAALRDPVIARVGEFHGLALTRSLARSSFALWPVRGGLWQDPIVIERASENASAKSLDSELREVLQQRLALPAIEGDRLEHLAIFSRWYYSSWRDGDWFGFETVSGLNYRRLVRAISKLLTSGDARGGA